MEESTYNSLTEKLIQNGILGDVKNAEVPNFFERKDISKNENSDYDIENKNIQSDIDLKNNKNKKRLNEYDLDLIKNHSADDLLSKSLNIQTLASLKLLKNFFNSDKKENKIKYQIGNLFYKLFPELYRAKIVKDAMTQLIELGIDTKTLLDKTIPYGESDMRYEDLIKYLSCANKVQTKLKKKI